MCDARAWGDAVRSCAGVAARAEGAWPLGMPWELMCLLAEGRRSGSCDGRVCCTTQVHHLWDGLHV